MGFRFRRGIRLLPGVRLNLSKGLPSVSIGRRGFTTNIGKRGVRTTIGLPGSGLSYTTRTARWSRSRRGERLIETGDTPPARGVNPLLVVLLIAAAVIVLAVFGHR